MNNPPPPTIKKDYSADNNNEKNETSAATGRRITDYGPTAPLRMRTLMPDHTDPQRLCKSAACPIVPKSNKAGGGQSDISKGGECRER